MKITYLYLALGSGLLTIAVYLQKTEMVDIGIAFCSPDDQFIEEKGKSLANIRLMDKSGFFVQFKRNNIPLEQQIHQLVSRIISNNWGSIIDFEMELETVVYELITETITNTIDEEINLPIIIHTNIIPNWAKRAVIDNNFSLNQG